MLVSTFIDMVMGYLFIFLMSAVIVIVCTCIILFIINYTKRKIDNPTDINDYDFWTN